MTKKENGKDLATKDKQELAVAEDQSMFFEDAGAGQEEMSKDDYAIPRLGLLQALSPQLQKQKSEFIEGAEQGQIFDSVTHETFDGEVGVTLIPVTYRRAHIEWGLREKGGGFVADHGSDSSVLDGCEQDDKGRQINKAGNQIVVTAEYYCLMVDAETGIANPIVLSMASSQLKKSRRWNTMINQLKIPKPDGGLFNPAMFYRAYQLTTVPESNDQGSWFGWDVTGAQNTIDLPGGRDLYMQARAFREAVVAGDVKAAPPAEEASGSEEDDDSPM